MRGLGKRRTLGSLAATWGWDFGFGLRGRGGVEGAAWGADLAEPMDTGVAGKFFYANTCSNGNGLDVRELIRQEPGWFEVLRSEVTWQRREKSDFVRPVRAAAARSKYTLPVVVA